MAHEATDRELRHIRRGEVRERQEDEFRRRQEEMRREIDRLTGSIRHMEAEGVQINRPQGNQLEIGNEVRQQRNLPNMDDRSVASDSGFLYASDMRNARELEELQELEEMDENWRGQQKGDPGIYTSVTLDYRDLEDHMPRHQQPDQTVSAPARQEVFHDAPRREPPRTLESYHEDPLTQAPRAQVNQSGDQQRMMDQSFRVETNRDVGYDSTWDPHLGSVMRDAGQSGDDSYLKIPLMRPPDTQPVGDRRDPTIVRPPDTQPVGDRRDPTMVRPPDTQPVGDRRDPTDKTKGLVMDRVRKEQGELRDRQSYFERRSERLRQDKLEEQRRTQTILDYEAKLKQEIEKTMQAERELTERIQQMELEEQDLERRRKENDRMEQELLEYRKQDEEMARRLQLLRAKEQLMMERAELGRRNVKNEFPDDRAELHSSTPYRDSYSRYDREPVYRPREDHYERYPQPQRPSYDPRVATSDSRNRAGLDEVTGPPRVNSQPDDDSKFPLFKMGLPRVPEFKGKQFEQWKREVNCLLEAKIYPDFAIAQAVRNSLKDDTRQILLTIRPTATSVDILRKVEEIYGNVRTGDNIVSEFYSAKQKERETVSAWGVRLETLFQQAVEKEEIDVSRRDKKFKERFWRGMFSEKLKNASRVSYESDDTFEILRKKARREEEEEEKEKKSDESRQGKASVSQQLSATDKDRTLQELLEKMKRIERELQTLRRGDDAQPYDNYWQPRGFYRGGYRGYPRRRQRDQTSDGQKQDKTKDERQPQQSNPPEKKLEKGSLN